MSRPINFKTYLISPVITREQNFVGSRDNIEKIDNDIINYVSANNSAFIDNKNLMLLIQYENIYEVFYITGISKLKIMIQASSIKQKIQNDSLLKKEVQSKGYIERNIDMKVNDTDKLIDNIRQYEGTVVYSLNDKLVIFHLIQLGGQKIYDSVIFQKLKQTIHGHSMHGGQSINEKNKSSKIMWNILLVIIIILIASASYVWYKKHQDKKKVPSSIVSDIELQQL